MNGLEMRGFWLAPDGNFGGGSDRQGAIQLVYRFAQELFEASYADSLVAAYREGSTITEVVNLAESLGAGLNAGKSSSVAEAAVSTFLFQYLDESERDGLARKHQSAPGVRRRDLGQIYPFTEEDRRRGGKTAYILNTGLFSVTPEERIAAIREGREKGKRPFYTEAEKRVIIELDASGNNLSEIARALKEQFGESIRSSYHPESVSRVLQAREE